MSKKSQATLDYLMTYGWAIFALLVAIGTLSYFGVLDPVKFFQEDCTFPIGIACIDNPSLDYETKTVTLALTNVVGEDIEVLDYILEFQSPSYFECVWNDSNTIKRLDADGNEESYDLSDCEKNNSNVEDFDTNNRIEQNSQFTVQLECGSAEWDRNVLYKAKFRLQYRNTETLIRHESVGTIRGKVE